MRNSNILKQAVALFFLSFQSIALPASPEHFDCEISQCDHVLRPTNNWLNVNSSIAGKAVRPGDMICLAPGHFANLNLRGGLQGSAQAPITIVNCGGPVTIGGTHGIQAWKDNGQTVKHIKITGTGSKKDYYGIELVGTDSGRPGVSLAANASDIEVAYLDIHNSGFAGIMAKTDPTCVDTKRPSFVFNNLHIHNNYIHDLGGEGLYIGNSFYNGGEGARYGLSACSNTMLYPHAIKHVRVHNNLIKNTEAEGLQVGSSTEDVELYNNTVINPGTDPFASYQDNGIQIGLGTTGKWYNNIVKDAPGSGFMIQGSGNIQVSNNLILNPGNGAYVHKDVQGSLEIIGNTFVTTDSIHAVHTYNTPASKSYRDNFIVIADVSKAFNDQAGSPVKENNIIVSSVQEAGFVDPSSGNYNLAEGSPYYPSGAGAKGDLGYQSEENPGTQTDTTAPILTLNGESNYKLSIGEVFNDPGAKASDNVDGDISSLITVTSNVNKDAAGDYEIVYSVSDSSGNSAQLKRFIKYVDPSVPSASQKLNLSPANIITATPNTYPERLLDEQGLVGDPRAGDKISLEDSDHWRAWSSLHEAVIDLGSQYELSDIYFFDAHGDGEFKAYYGSPSGGWTLLFTDTLLSYLSWKGKALSARTRYIKFTKNNGARVNEVVIYGKSIDTQPPVITLKGSSPMELEVGQTFSDPGVSAMDNIDGDISAQIKASHNINSAQAGEYQVTYSVSDSSGNAAQAKRTVIYKEPISNPNPGASEKLALGPASIVSATAGTYPERMLDEQSLAADPRAGDNVSLENSLHWRAWSSLHEMVIDLGEEKDLSDIYFYDAHGDGEFKVYAGSPQGGWTELFSDSLLSYLKWKRKSVSARTRYLKLTKNNGARVNEIIIYGQSVLPSDPKKLSLSPSNIVRATANTFPERILDQQELVGSPKDGDSVNLKDSEHWRSWSGDHEVVVDLGKVTEVTDIHFFDAHGEGLFIVYSGSDAQGWTEIFRDTLKSYLKWKGKQVKATTRYLRFTKNNGSRVNEVVIYGR